MYTAQDPGVSATLSPKMNMCTPYHLANSFWVELHNMRVWNTSGLEEAHHNWSGQLDPEHYLIKCMGG